MTTESQQPQRCGIVLSGGEGKRLQPFIRRMLGLNLPKQYVSFIGTRSMLEHTFDRAERLISRERLFTVIARDHLRHAEVQTQIEMRPPHTMILQPINRETGPGLLLPLMHVLKWNPGAAVAVFPSDHFVLQEDKFMSYVRLAFEAVEKLPTKIVFLGVEPTDPEPEYGYIIPDSEEPGWFSPVQSIKAFVEKPERKTAAGMIALGGLWNTMVMVFRPETLMNLIRFSSPRLYRAFKKIYHALGTSRESFVVEEMYRKMEPVNFSKDLLELCDLHSGNQLSVIPVKGVFWSDWGSEHRLISVLKDHIYLDWVLGESSPDGDGDQNLITASGISAIQ